MTCAGLERAEKGRGEFCSYKHTISKADPARRVGAEFSDIDTGLRLRYEFSRKFASYVGVVYEGKFGQSASYARRVGESTVDFRFVFGVRIWL